MKLTKQIFPIVVTILMILTISLPALAQDTPTPEDIPTEEATAFGTDEPTPAATAEVTPEVVTATPQATPIIILITPPPPVDPPPPADNGGNVFGSLGWVAFLFTVSALAFVLVTWIRELRKSAAAGDQNAKNLLTFVTATQNMLPVDGFLALIERMDKQAKDTTVPGEIDDKIVEQIRIAVYEALGREMPPTTPPQSAGL